MIAARRRLFLLPLWSVFAREMLRFLRQRGRLAGALGTPLLLWLVLGGGFGDMRLYFPGALLMVVLFTAIFNAISIIEDRNEGFLQGVLVAPVHGLAIVLGKVLGTALLACGQALLLLLISLVPLGLGPLQCVQALGILFLVAVSLSALGFAFAWRMDSVQGFHAVMNLLLFPMWMLSGAFFPIAGAAGVMRLLMSANPLTYGLAALRRVLYGPEHADRLGDPQLALSLLVSGGAALALLALAVLVAGRPETS